MQLNQDRLFLYLPLQVLRTNIIHVKTHLTVDVKNAVWGGLMTARARAKGVQGVVIDGRVRDLNEHREMKFPVSFSPCF